MFTCTDPSGKKNGPLRKQGARRRVITPSGFLQQGAGERIPVASFKLWHLQG